MALPDNLLHSRVTVDQNQSAAAAGKRMTGEKLDFFQILSSLVNSLMSIQRTYVLWTCLMLSDKFQICKLLLFFPLF